MEISKQKPILATSEDALEVANMINQMRKALNQAFDSRSWPSLPSHDMTVLLDSMQNSVHSLIGEFFDFSKDEPTE